jgi:hypothetical protein
VEVLRDLSFDYGERAQGRTFAGLEYCHSDTKGLHIHFWVPGGTAKTERQTKLTAARDEALRTLRVDSMSWDEIPAIYGNRNMRGGEKRAT